MEGGQPGGNSTKGDAEKLHKFVIIWPFLYIMNYMSKFKNITTVLKAMHIGHFKGHVCLYTKIISNIIL